MRDEADGGDELDSGILTELQHDLEEVGGDIYIHAKNVVHLVALSILLSLYNDQSRHTYHEPQPHHHAVKSPDSISCRSVGSRG